MKNIFNKFAFFIALSFVFISCGNLTTSENDDSIPQGKGKITISTDLQNGRSVLPTAIEEDTTGLKWELVGIKDGTQQIIESWTDGIDETGTVTVAYQSMTSDLGIVIDTGTWDFTLTASLDSDDGSVAKVLVSEIVNATINAGENKLNFVMQEATGDTAASGSIEFTLNFPTGVINKGIATLTPLAGGNSFTQDFTANAGTSNQFLSSITYKNENISAGYYILKIELQQEKGDATIPTVESKTINTYSCLIRVAPGLTSKGVYTLDELAPLYTITYKLNEGTFDSTTSAVPTSYNAYTSFELPTPTYQGHYFAGWYTDSELTNPVELDGNGKYRIKQDTTLYAKWNKEVTGITHADSTLYISNYEGLCIFRDIVNGSLPMDITIPANESISDAKSLDWNAMSSGNWLSVELEEDICVTDAWIPIGGPDASRDYGATFDGNNHTITLSNGIASDEYVALFSFVTGTIKNLVVEGEINSQGNNAVAGICACSYGGTFEHCVNKCKINSNTSSGTGGIVGYSDIATTIKSCVNMGEISSSLGTIGGIVGAANSSINITIEKSINLGKITGTSNVSGIFGLGGLSESTQTITDCINIGEIKATGESGYAAGIITLSSDISVSNCINAGIVDASQSGAITSSYSGTYSNCYYDSSKINNPNDSNPPEINPKTTSELCNDSSILSNWLREPSCYPLPNIVATDSSGGISKLVWNDICGLAKVDTSSSGSSGTVTGTPVSDFSTLQTNIAKAPTDGTVTELCLTNDINMTEYLNINSGQNIVLKTNGNYSIYRGSGFTGSFFTVNSGATFKLGNDDGIYKITLDGRTSSSETEGLSASYPFINQEGTLTVSNCIMQYNKSGGSVLGGAIYSEGTTTITNTSFMNNANTFENTSQGFGGAIYLSNDGNATISNCTFENNTTYQRGGAIYIGGSTSNTVITVSGSTFKNNIATNSTGKGGAICVSSLYGTVSLTSLTCSNNCVDNATPTSEDIAYCGSISSVTKNIGNISCENIYIDKGNTLNVIENINNTIKLTISEYVTGSQIINFNNFAANFTLADTNYTINEQGYVEYSGGGIAYNVGEAYKDDSGTVLGYIFDVGGDYIKIANPTPLTSDDEAGLQWCKSSLNSSLTSITDGLEMKNKITSIGITNYPLYAALPSGDWYVPTQSEFELMLQNITNGQIDFEYSTFWTSTINSKQIYYYCDGSFALQSCDGYCDCLYVMKINF